MSGAIEGEGGAYVPCFELPAPLPALPEGAIVGSGVGFVSRDMLASPMPADPTGAIVGSGVGFVAKPCECPEPFFDNFAREITTPIEQTHGVSLAQGVRSARLVRRERTTVYIGTLPAPSNLRAYWATNGLIPDPINGGTLSGPGRSAPGGPPLTNMHYDVEERVFTAPAAFDGWPANCTKARFYLSGGEDPNGPHWGHQVASWPMPLHDTTLQVYSGFWAGAGTGWDDGILVGEVLIPAGVAYVAAEIEWAPVEGMPDFMFRVASAVEDSPYSTGLARYVDPDGIILITPDVALERRYPEEQHGQYPWPPGGGDVWAQNDSDDFAFAQDYTPTLEVTFPGPPGWGQGSLVDWNNAYAGGDDWSDSVMVSGSMGILRTHLSTRADDSSYAEVYHDEQLFQDFDDYIRVRFDNVTGPVTPYTAGVRARVGPDSARLVIYPDSDRLHFGPTLNIAGGGMIWTEWVVFHIQEDATSSRVKWWQEGDSEPGAWMAESTGGGWHLVGGTWDYYHFVLTANAPYSRDLTLYITCLL